MGVLVHCNYGDRWSLRIAGVSVGRELKDLMPRRVAAETMTGTDHLRVWALPHDHLHDILRAYNRLR